MATAPDIRFDCRYCNKPVVVPAKAAGQRTKCPSCKNPVVVPSVGGGLARSHSDASDGEQLNRVDDRPVRRRSSLGETFRPLVRLIVLAAMAYGAWVVYGWWQGQAKKPVGQLLTEMASNPANEAVLRKKISDDLAQDHKMTNERVDALAQHARDDTVRVRQVVAEMLGISVNPKAISVLKPMLESDKSESVRVAAARALGELGFEAKDKPMIKYLINRMEKEKDQTVIAEMHTALRVMTNNTDQNKPTAEAWAEWWRSAEARFTFTKKATR